MKIESKQYDTAKGTVELFRLTNGNGCSVTLSTVGAGVVAVEVPDRDGNIADVALGYGNPADYFYDGPYAGKIPGRYANRIAKGRFEIDGKEYNLVINNGPNALHGGPESFGNRIWAATPTGDGVEFSLTSADGEEGYPGEMHVKAVYTWTDDNELRLDLVAVCNKKTIVNLTNHSYFNLDGEGSGSILDHKLRLCATRYLPTDETLIPTGELADVAGTPMDFLEEKAIGADIKQDFPALVYGKGYDNCWVIDKEKAGELKLAAVLSSDKSGRVLEVSTTQPAVQVYTGNWLSGCPKGKGGMSYVDYDGVAIECQGMPDAPNHPNFPSQELAPGETYRQTIIFKFKTKK